MAIDKGKISDNMLLLLS